MPDNPAVIPLNLAFVQAYLLPGADGRAILVDTGMANTALRLKRLIEAHGYAPSALSLILLTHAHVDHIGGITALRAWTPAPVALGRGDVQEARTGQQPPAQHMSGLMRLTSRLLARRGVPRFEPDLLVDEELDLAPYGIAGRALSTPGHSPGSLSIWLESRDLLIGDLIMGSLISPARPAMPRIVHDAAQVERSIARILALRPRRIYAAHGGPFSPEAVQRAFHVLAVPTARTDAG